MTVPAAVRCRATGCDRQQGAGVRDALGRRYCCAGCRVRAQGGTRAGHTGSCEQRDALARQLAAEAFDHGQESATAAYWGTNQPQWPEGVPETAAVLELHGPVPAEVFEVALHLETKDARTRVYLPRDAVRITRTRP